MEVFVTGILFNFGNDNINCRMCFSSIGIVIGNGNIVWVCLGYWKVLVTGMLYGFAIIIETIIMVTGVL